MMATMVGIGHPKFGYPRVIPEPEPKFGYALGLCLNTMGIFGLGTHKVLNFGVFLGTLGVLGTPNQIVTNSFVNRTPLNIYSQIPSYQALQISRLY